MADVYHKDMSGADLHVPGFMQSTEPTTGVKAGMYWIDTSAGAGKWVLKVRNSTNDAWETIGGGSSSSYRTSFTSSNLSSGILTVSHNLGEQYCQVTVINDSDKMIIPDDITFTDSNNLSVDLSSFGTINGTWNVVVTA